VNRQTQAFDWRAAMAFGLGVLKLSPKKFWSMTPRELEAALAGHYGRAPGARPPRRSDLEHLMAQYPDDHSAEQDIHDPPQRTDRKQ